VVLITAVSSSTVTATRGYDGTTPKSHAAGATFTHTTVAKDFDEANAHVNAATGVHGLAGGLVGTTDAPDADQQDADRPDPGRADDHRHRRDGQRLADRHADGDRRDRAER
jgi:hypothetical protein